jgi:hypothetical protein
VPVLAQHRDLGEYVARLAHAHADFLAVLLGEDANGARLDHEEAIGGLARVADGLAERKESGLRVLGQSLELGPREW